MPTSFSTNTIHPLYPPPTTVLTTNTPHPHQVYTFIVSTAIARNVPPTWAFYLVPILNASSVLGHIIPGLRADRLTGAINMYLLISLLTFLSITALRIPVSGQAGMIVFALLFGFGPGGLNALAPVVLGEISDVKSIGLRTGLCYSSTGIGWYVSPPLSLPPSPFSLPVSSPPYPSPITSLTHSP